MSLEELAKAICEADAERAKLLSGHLLEEGIVPKRILLEGLSRGLTQLGELWDKQEVFLADILIAVEAFQTALQVIKPYLKTGNVDQMGKIVIGTVEGDIHYIGKNIVATLLKFHGFEVVDVGEDVSTAKFMEVVNTETPHILAMSCLVSTSLPVMAKVITELQKKGLRQGVKVMVGGPPVTPEFAKKIGADLYAHDAFEAIRVVKEASLY